MPCVDLDPPHRPRGAEADDRPVIARPAPALRFPAVAHVRGVAGHDQVVPRAEEHVAARDARARHVRRPRDRLHHGGGALSQSATTSPCTRSRATPPSGKMSQPQMRRRRRRRRWRTGCASRRCSGERARISRHAAGSSRSARRHARVDRARLGIIALKNAVSTSTPRTTPRTPRRTMHQSWSPSSRRRRGLPAVHPFAALGDSPSFQIAGPGLIKFSFGAKNSSFAATTAAPSPLRRQVDEIKERFCGHWSLIGRWSLVVGHWSLVIGRWSLVVGHSRRPAQPRDQALAVPHALAAKKRRPHDAAQRAAGAWRQRVALVQA